MSNTSPTRRQSSTDHQFLDREGSVRSSISEENLIIENLQPRGLLDTVHESQDESEAFDSPAEESDLDSNETNAEQVGHPAGERHAGPRSWGFFAHFYGAKTRRQLRPINPQGKRDRGS